MNISALSQINFSSNMPIYHVYKDDKSGVRSELKGSAISGVVKALTRRLNDQSTDEAQFIVNQGDFMDDYKKIPITTSTYIGRGDNQKYFILYGKDAKTANGLRLDCYRKGNISASDVFRNIFRWIINDNNKKVKLKDTGEEVGLILYTVPKSEKYNQLKSFEIITKSGRVIDTFPNTHMYDEEAEMEEAIEEYYREKTLLAQKKPDLIKVQPKQDKIIKPTKPTQGELFSKEEMTTPQKEEDYVWRRANLPMYPTHSKRRIRG